MGDYKFERFFYSEDKNDEHYLREIENISDDDYNALYKGKMYCPLCHNAQLTRVISGDSVYLRTNPHQQHLMPDKGICMYEYNTASNTTVKKYVEELKDKGKITSLLEATLRKMFSALSVFSSTKSETNTKDDIMIIKTQKDEKTVVRKIIPHYSLNSWGKNTPQDKLMVIYGKMYLTTYKKEGSDNTYIYFFDKKPSEKNKPKTSCLKPSSLEVNDGYYAVAILGECKQNGIYYNIWLNKPVDTSIFIKSLTTT